MNTTIGQGTTNGTAPGMTPARGSSSAIMATEGGWTSIGSGIAAPPLLVPQTPMMTAHFGNAGTSTVANAPRYPNMASNDTTPVHSVLVDPAKSSPPAAATQTNPIDNLATGWGDNPGSTGASITRNGNNSPLGSTVRDSGLVPVQNTTAAAPDYRNPSSGRTTDGWPDKYPLTQQNSPTLGTANGAVSVSRPATNPGTNPAFEANNQTNGFGANYQNQNSSFGANNQASGQFASQPNGQFPSQANGQSLNGPVRNPAGTNM